MAVDGRSGSGKSSIARELQAEWSGSRLLALEELYPGWDGLLPAIDLLAQWILRPLASGKAARYRRYNWVEARFADDWVDLGRPSRLIVEGVGALAASLREFISVGVWVEADAATRYQRAMARDGDLYRPHWQRWAAQEETYLRSDDPRSVAEVVIDTL